MAKLTARFELEDRVSKKIRKIQNGFRALEKYRKMTKRQSEIDIRKESKSVLRTIDRIQRSMKRKLGAQMISISAEDGASAVIQKVQAQLAGLPASLTIKIGAKGSATAAFERLRDLAAGFKGFTVSLYASDEVTPAMERIKRYMQSALKNGYSVTIRVIDHVMKTVGRISAGIDSLTGKNNVIQLSLNEKVTAQLAAMQKNMPDVGKASASAAPASPKYDFSMLDSIADTFMKKVNDIASKFYPETIIAELDKFAASFMKKADEIASKFSPETILAELDKFTTSFMGKADEIASKFSPATILAELDKFTTSFMGKVNEIASKFSPETILAELDRFADSFMKKVDGVVSKFSPETILKELDKFTDSFMKKIDDVVSKFSPETILKELDHFTDSFMKKVDDVVGKFSPDKLIDRAEQFVNDTIDRISEKFDFLNPDKILEKVEQFTSSLFGGIDKKFGKFSPDAIIEKAEAFVDKIVSKIAKKFEKFSPDKIIEKAGELIEKIFSGIAEKLGKLNIGGLLGGGTKKEKSKGGLTAGGSNGPKRPDLAKGSQRTVTAPKSSGKSAKKTGGALGGCCCCIGVTRGKSSKVEGRNKSSKRGSSAKGSKQASVNTPKTKGAGKGIGALLKGLGDSKALKGGMKGLKGAAKGIPGIGELLSLTDLAGINKDNAGEKVGSAGGGLAGAAAGAAIGSVVPGVGTLIGGAVGGIAGSLGGSSLGEAFDSGALKDTWNDISKAAQSAWTTIQDTWGSVSSWFMENVWTPVSSAVVGVATSIWSNIVNAWTTIQGIFSTVSSWFMENVWTPVSSAVVGVATSIWSNIVNAWTTIQSVFSTVSGWFMSTVWGPVKSAVVGVATSIWSKITGAWDKIKSVFSTVSGWFMDTVWNPVKDMVKNVGKGISDAFQTALDTVKNIWKGLSGWFEKHIKEPLVKVGTAISDAFSAAFDWVKKIWDKTGGKMISGIMNFVTGGGGDKKKKTDKNATGGYITKPTISWIGEAGKEFVIPVDNNRGRGKMLLSQAASKLGMRVVDDMGAASAQSSAVPAGAGGVSSSASVSAAASVEASGLGGTASSLGKQFTEGFDSGISKKAVDMDGWKEKNIGTPFNALISSSSGYGKQVVAGYAKGQNTSPTGTDSFLKTKVKTPYQSAVNQSSSWGAATVKGYSAGQNAKDTGTSQYVSTHINKPFVQSRDSANGWGSGLIGHFVSGMTAKGSEVKQAAKDMAKKVEDAFREELDIHSPSRVMMSLGRFASVGVVKGLGSVDVKKYAEKQAGSLAAAFSGMGAAGGSVKEWLLAAMKATNTPISWLPGLMTIAQHESGGNPNSINLWDSNAKAGHPSQGLMQTIPSTFEDHKAPGMNDIRNPIHNAAAAIGYIKSRYGSISNVPGIKSMAHGGPYVGYANGGLITKEQIARVGEGNKREWIIPEERGIRGRYLLQKAAQALGMEVSDPSQTEPAALSAGTVSAAVKGGGQTVQKTGTKEIKIEFSGDQHFHNGQDADSLAAKIKQALIDELQKDIYTGAKGAVAFD
ncbi:transglycosylase SLT domain-containing protein [Bacillus sp. FSL K6-2865]|uniref:transglycosylase SLT domain-containing protein n=1 Tax=Bacillus sp. FSL K6-2865 TaxID=2975295 RepID=UPI00324D32AC